MKTLREEKAGVRWTLDSEGANTIHYMEFDGRVLSGSWVGPRWVFWALTSMSSEERMTYNTHDEYMGAINAQIVKLRGKK